MREDARSGSKRSIRRAGEADLRHSQKLTGKASQAPRPPERTFVCARMRSRSETQYMRDWRSRYFSALHSQSIVGKALALLVTPERTSSA